MNPPRPPEPYSYSPPPANRGSVILPGPVVSSPPPKRSSVSAVNKPTPAPSPPADDGFGASLAIGYATNNAIVGGLIGGSIAGGIVGDMLNTSDSPPTAETPSVDFGSSDAGSCSGGDW